jgi:hypothetical protein
VRVGIYSRRMFLGLVLLTSAAVLRFVLAPQLLDLRASYARKTFYNAESRFRNSPAGDWQNVKLIARRVDQAQVIAEQVAVIQGDMHWFSDSGQPIFENTGLYGVDRRTRLNVPGYGDIPRNGFFLFPPHLGRVDFIYWDPMFIGSRYATYERTESQAGLTIFVFRFLGIGMDETAGYSYLPDVPALYRTLTDGQGTLWIEPLSGTLVDYEEEGISYFVDGQTGVRLSNFYEWSDRYTLETKAAQLSLAQASRLRILALETWLPLLLALAGFCILILALLVKSKNIPAPL